MTLSWTNIQVRLGDLRAWSDNPRLSTKKQAERLLKSFDEFGQVQTIAVSPDLDVYDGHQRLSALLTIHGKDYTVDARQSSRALTDEERRKLVIYLHSGAVGGWDWDALSGWNAQEVIGWGMDDAVLKEWKRDVTALGALIEAEKPPVEDVEPQIDRAEELREKWGVESGQLWQLGEHRLICGDCTDKAVVERVMVGEKAQAVLTDPPYGINQKCVPGDEPENLHNLINDCIPLLPIENAVCVAFQSTRTFPTWLDAIRNNGHKFERILSLYKEAQCTFPWRGWILISESILVSSLGNPDWQDVHPYHYDAYSVPEVSHEIPDELGWHGSIKPIEVVMDLLSRIAGESRIVYDPFLGSGTTLIACENLGRKCRAIEISPAYVAVALQRWADLTGKTPELIGTAE